MMRDADGDGDVGGGQGIDGGIAGEDRHGRVWGGAQIEADDVDAEFTADLIEECALSASDVEDLFDVAAVFRQAADDGGVVSEKALGAGEVAVGIANDFFREGRIFEEFGGVRAIHLLL